MSDLSFYKYLLSFILSMDCFVPGNFLVRKIKITVNFHPFPSWSPRLQLQEVRNWPCRVLTLPTGPDSRPIVLKTSHFKCQQKGPACRALMWNSAHPYYRLRSVAHCLTPKGWQVQLVLNKKTWTFLSP